MPFEQQVQALKPHIALNVNDLERSLEFYKKLLGIEPSKVRTGYAKFDVHNPALNLTLNEHRFEGQGALSHLGIQVSSTNDVLATREQWIAAGLITRDEMQTSCCYALQDKSWVRDPDGNQWEVFVVIEDNLTTSASCECGDVPSADLTASVAPSASSTSCCAPSPVEITHESSVAETRCC